MYDEKKFMPLPLLSHTHLGHHQQKLTLVAVPLANLQISFGFEKANSIFHTIQASRKI